MRNLKKSRSFVCFFVYMFLIFLILNIILEMEQKIIGGKAEIRRPSAQPPLPSAPTTTTAATAATVARGFSPVAKGGSQNNSK